MKNKILFTVFVIAAVLVTVYAASATNQAIDVFSINSTPVTSVTLGQTYLYQTDVIFLSGYQPSTLAYGLVTAPDTMTISGNGLITWTPTQAGTYLVNLSINSFTTSPVETNYQSFNIVVNPVVVPPVTPTETTTKMLEIEKVTVNVGGSKDSLTSEGTVDQDAELGDDIEVTVRVANNFEIDNDSTILRDITMDISSDLDEADGLDDSISKLRAGDNDDMTFSFTIDPETVDPADAPFDIDIDVEGELKNGTMYRDSWTISLDMNTKAKDLSIIDASITPSTVKNCVDNKLRVTVDARNIGTKDLPDGMIMLKIPSLGISEIISNVNLDNGDSDSYTGYVTIPKDTAADSYLLEIQAHTSRTTSSVTDVSALDVVVLACNDNSGNNNGNGNQTTNPGNNNNNNDVVIIPDVSVTGTPVSTAVGKRGLFDSDSSLYLVLLVALVILLLVIAILLMVRMTRN